MTQRDFATACLNEARDARAGCRLERGYADTDERLLTETRQMLTNLQVFVQANRALAGLNMTRDALLRLNDLLDDAWDDSCAVPAQALETAREEAQAEHGVMA